MDDRSHSVLAKPYDYKFQQPTFDLATKLGVWLDTVDKDYTIRFIWNLFFQLSFA
jgi:hypothetical protein